MTKKEEKIILNTKLKIILNSLNISWENYKEINFINNTIKGDNIYNKKSLIEKYGKKRH